MSISRDPQLFLCRWMPGLGWNYDSRRFAAKRIKKKRFVQVLRACVCVRARACGVCTLKRRGGFSGRSQLETAGAGEVRGVNRNGCWAFEGGQRGVLREGRSARQRWWDKTEEAGMNKSIAHRPGKKEAGPLAAAAACVWLTARRGAAAGMMLILCFLRPIRTPLRRLPLPLVLTAHGRPSLRRFRAVG